MSNYPPHAVEIQLTVLLPVPEESDPDPNKLLDDPLYEALEKAGLTWWLDRLSEFDEYGLVRRLDYKRPTRHKRPRAKKHPLNGGIDV